MFRAFFPPKYIYEIKKYLSYGFTALCKERDGELPPYTAVDIGVWIWPFSRRFLLKMDMDGLGGHNQMKSAQVTFMKTKLQVS